MRHFIKVDDLDRQGYLSICQQAQRFQERIEQGHDVTHLCPGRVLATAFFEESSRTLSVLQSAIIRLGGGHTGINPAEPDCSGQSREQPEDILRSLALVSDLVAVRHRDLNLEHAARSLEVPLINAMSGRYEHSLVALGVVYSLCRRFQDLGSLQIGVYGMTGSSRPARAMIKAMSLFGATIYEDPVIESLAAPADVHEFVRHHGARLVEAELLQFLERVDCLFVVEGKPQKGTETAVMNEYESKFCTISISEVQRLKPGAVLMYFMPRTLGTDRVTVSLEVDEHPQVINKQRAREWVYATMALITHLLGVEP